MGRVVYLQIEGCNFGRTIDDTNDLSTIRGASLAYIDAPGEIARALARRIGASAEDVTVLAQAASFGLYRLTTERQPPEIEAEIAQLLRGAGAWGEETDPSGEACAGTPSQAAEPKLLWRVIPHLTFSFAATALNGDIAGYPEAKRLLYARVQERQFRRPTTDIPRLQSPGATGYCAVDGLRPLSSEAEDGAREKVSESVRVRRAYGRMKKQSFYRGEVLASGVTESALKDSRFGFLDQDTIFAKSFEDLVADPPGELKPQLSNKIAVLYLDGNKFSKARRAAFDLAGSEQAERVDSVFSAFLRRKRAELLLALLSACDADRRMYRRTNGKNMFRFETLLWGGDESMVVFPAWKALEMVAALAGAVGAGWSAELPVAPGSKPIVLDGLTHAAGVVIADVATPIRFLKGLAGDLADQAKTAAVVDRPKGAKAWQLPSAVQMMILESADPPANGVPAFCRDHYGLYDPAAFTIGLDQAFARLREVMAAISDPADGLPRSQLFNILRKAQEIRSTTPVEAHCAAFKDKLTRYGQERFASAGVPGLFSHFQSQGNGLGYSDATPLLPFQRCAELWDYARPFSRDLLMDGAVA